MADKAEEQLGFALHGAGGIAGISGERIQIEGGLVGERIGFEVRPQVFDRIEFGGIGRQVLKVCRVWGDTFVEEFAKVGLEPIEDHDQRCAHLALHVLQKFDHTLSIDVGIRMQTEVQRQSITRGNDAQRGDGGDFLVGAGTLAQDGRAASRVPGAAHQRRHQQTGFVEEDQRRSQACGVFFTLGQSCWTQLRMRSSSRSIARRVGFCGENPRPCKRRPT